MNCPVCNLPILFSKNVGELCNCKSIVRTYLIGEYLNEKKKQLDQKRDLLDLEQQYLQLLLKFSRLLDISCHTRACTGTETCEHCEIEEFRKFYKKCVAYSGGKV